MTVNCLQKVQSTKSVRKRTMNCKSERRTGRLQALCCLVVATIQELIDVSFEYYGLLYLILSQFPNANNTNPPQIHHG